MEEEWGTQVVYDFQVSLCAYHHQADRARKSQLVFQWSRTFYGISTPGMLGTGKIAKLKLQEETEHVHALTSHHVVTNWKISLFVKNLLLHTPVSFK